MAKSKTPPVADMPVAPPKPLIGIVSEALDLSRALIESRGELTPELEDRLKLNTMELAGKIDSYAYVESRLEHEAVYWKTKAKEFSAVAAGFENARKRIRDNVKAAMLEMETDEIKGHDFRFKLSKCAPSLLVDEALLPVEFTMVVSKTIPDREKIATAMKDGFTITGAWYEGGVALRTFENPTREDKK